MSAVVFAVFAFGLLALTRKRVALGRVTVAAGYRDPDIQPEQPLIADRRSERAAAPGLGEVCRTPIVEHPHYLLTSGNAQMGDARMTATMRMLSGPGICGSRQR